jgi:CDP-diacylglycerol--serine O-phosphatidyltransferase
MLFSVIAAVLTAAAGLLMVSNFAYPSFKQVDMRGRVPFVVILSIAMSLVVVTLDPPRILFLMAIGFAVYPVFLMGWKKFRGIG